MSNEKRDEQPNERSAEFLARMSRRYDRTLYATTDIPSDRGAAAIADREAVVVVPQPPAIRRR